MDATIKPKKQRKAFNRVVKAISEIYDISYNDAMKVYKKADKNIGLTKTFISFNNI